MKDNLYSGLSELESNPYLCAIKYRQVRVKYIRRFPYGIHYSINRNEVKVIAFFHMKRDPNVWDERLK